MKRKYGQFTGWQAVVGSQMWHFMKDGVSLCGRFADARVRRGRAGAVEMVTCKNCEKACRNRGLG